MHPLLQEFALSLAAGTALAPLAEAPAGPFWQQSPAPDRADYADGIEELITDFNRQPPGRLADWAEQHPLTSDERFILEYNTSADRANALRPLPIAEHHRVLEIGCGCGPVSRHLWSRAQTLSVEASGARARAASYLLAGQENPHRSALLCADFHQLAGAGSFDWVILNGVLEYAAIYSGATEASPYVSMLEKARAFLRPGGRCVVAIENRLGLKYLAGAPEDHYGRTDVGLEGYLSLVHPRPPIRTFSRPELARLVAAAGYAETEFLFPFPDYKFPKMLVPDEPAAWSFAAARLIEESPSWRAPRAHHLNEAAFLRAAAADGLAGDFAHSFLAVATVPGPAGAAPLPRDIHYYPLRRDPSENVGIRFDLARGLVERRRLAPGEPHVVPSAEPPSGLNPRARLSIPNTLEGGFSSQPLAPEPSLWESLRAQIGSTVDQPSAYGAALTERITAMQRRYLASLPFVPTGDWTSFLAKLRGEFARSGLTDRLAGAMSFLEAQAPFAAASLAHLGVPAWCLWAPDWIPENLFPEPDGESVAFFDVEYLDFAARLPSPALAYRQLRVLRNKAGQPALAPHWPSPGRTIKRDTSVVRLPEPAATLTAESFWPGLAATEVATHVWFWAKVAEIVECAITASVVSPFVKAFETAQWATSLSRELASFVPPIEGGEAHIDEAEPLAPEREGPGSDELAAKERQIRELAGHAEDRLRLIERLEQQLRTTQSTLLDELDKKEEMINHLTEIIAQNEEAIGHITRTAPDSPLLRFFLERPTDLRDLEYATLIRGWAYLADGAQIDAIHLVVAGRTRPVEELLVRPDVDKAFGLEPGTGVGFAVSVDLTHASCALLLAVRSGTRWHFARLGTALRRNGPSIGAWVRCARTAVRHGPTAAWRDLPPETQRGMVAYLRNRRLWNLGTLAQHRPIPPPPARLAPPPQPAEVLPKITVVTPSYNQGKFLPRTMDSVVSQPGVRLDYIVQDGGSTDQSVAAIQTRAGRLHHWESVRDAGQADAIVRGFRHMECGPEDILGYLNSDDTLLPGALAWVAGYFHAHPEVDAIYSHRVLIDENDLEIGRWYTPAHDPELLRMIDFVPQETLFWRRRAHERAGGFDPSFHFAMDWDFLLRLERSGARIVRVPEFLACFRVHPTQKTTSQIKHTGEEEMRRLRRRELGRDVSDEEIRFWWERGLAESALIQRAESRHFAADWPRRPRHTTDRRAS